VFLAFAFRNALLAVRADFLIRSLLADYPAWFAAVVSDDLERLAGFDVIDRKSHHRFLLSKTL
jgi:hypothetical protein